MLSGLHGQHERLGEGNMSEIIEMSFWYIICATEGCELAGIRFPISENEAECGGCNTVYFKPE